MILSFIYADPICGEPDTRPWIVAKVHYMYFAMFSFFSTGLVMCLVSLASHPPSEEQIRGLTFWTRNEGLSSAKEVKFDEDGFETTATDGVIREALFGAEVAIPDSEEDLASERNGIANKKLVLDGSGKKLASYPCLGEFDFVPPVAWFSVPRYNFRNK